MYVYVNTYSLRALKLIFQYKEEDFLVDFLNPFWSSNPLIIYISVSMYMCEREREIEFKEKQLDNIPADWI